MRITNTGDTPLAVVTLRDFYDPTTLAFIRAAPPGYRRESIASQEHIIWDDLLSSRNPVTAGNTVSATLIFRVLKVASPVDNMAVAQAADSQGNYTEIEQVTVSAPVAALDLTVTAVPPAGSTVRAGERVTYTLITRNSGSTDLHQVHITSTIPPGADFILVTADSFATNACETPPAIGIDDKVVRWSLPLLALGNECLTSFHVRVRDTPRVASLINDSSVSALETPRLLTVRQVHPIAPTAITLADFTVEITPDGAQLFWSTVVEIDTWGFHLWRSETGRRAEATRITSSAILSQGATGSYRFLDAGAPRNRSLYYWLEEIDRVGRSEFYGPAVVGASNAVGERVLLPLIIAAGN